MNPIWSSLLAASRAGETVALATVVGVDGSAPRAGGARMIVHANGSIEGTIGGGNLEYRVIAQALEVIASRVPRRYQVHLTRDLGMCCGGAMDVYIEAVVPEERLVIYGAGHVGQAVARLAAELEFGITVVDERDEWNTTERFPAATRVVGDPRRHVRGLNVESRTYLLITTHDHALDQDLLEILLDRPFAWLGLIGSRAKIAKFFLRLKAAGADETLFRRVHAPVGLDIGAETPAEIAVSILAEIVRIRRGVTRPPISLAEIPLAARGVGKEG